MASADHPQPISHSPILQASSAPPATLCNPACLTCAASHSSITVDIERPMRARSMQPPSYVAGPQAHSCSR
jgi:hypothetical protein